MTRNVDLKPFANIFADFKTNTFLAIHNTYSRERPNQLGETLMDKRALPRNFTEHPAMKQDMERRFLVWTELMSHHQEYWDRFLRAAVERELDFRLLKRLIWEQMEQEHDLAIKQMWYDIFFNAKADFLIKQQKRAKELFERVRLAFNESHRDNIEFKRAERMHVWELAIYFREKRRDNPYDNAVKWPAEPSKLYEDTLAAIKNIEQRIALIVNAQMADKNVWQETKKWRKEDIRQLALKIWQMVENQEWQRSDFHLQDHKRRWDSVHFDPILMGNSRNLHAHTAEQRDRLSSIGHAKETDFQNREMAETLLRQSLFYAGYAINLGELNYWGETIGGGRLQEDTATAAGSMAVLNGAGGQRYASPELAAQGSDAALKAEAGLSNAEQLGAINPQLARHLQAVAADVPGVKAATEPKESPDADGPKRITISGEIYRPTSHHGTSIPLAPLPGDNQQTIIARKGLDRPEDKANKDGDPQHLHLVVEQTRVTDLDTSQSDRGLKARPDHQTPPVYDAAAEHDGGPQVEHLAQTHAPQPAPTSEIARLQLKDQWAADEPRALPQEPPHSDPNRQWQDRQETLHLVSGQRTEHQQMLDAEALSKRILLAGHEQAAQQAYGIEKRVPQESSTAEASQELQLGAIQKTQTIEPGQKTRDAEPPAPGYDNKSPLEKQPSAETKPHQDMPSDRKPADS